MRIVKYNRKTALPYLNLGKFWLLPHWAVHIPGLSGSRPTASSLLEVLGSVWKQKTREKCMCRVPVFPKYQMAPKIPFASAPPADSTMARHSRFNNSSVRWIAFTCMLNDSIWFMHGQKLNLVGIMLSITSTRCPHRSFLHKS